MTSASVGPRYEDPSETGRRYYERDKQLAAQHEAESPIAPRFPPEVGIGHSERVCALCQRTWRGPNQCGNRGCTSTEFAEVYHPPKLSEPEPVPAYPAPTEEQLRVLRHLKQATEAFSATLHAAGDALRGSRIGIVDTALSITGDAPPERVAGLSLSLQAFNDVLQLALEDLHAT